MTDADSILILSACTASKTPEAARGAVPAERLYTGQQHRRLMRGVGLYRKAGEPAGAVDLHIVSAGHGVVSAKERIGHYDATFAGMPRLQLRRQATRLRVPTSVSRLLAQPRKLSLLLLGESYLQAAHLSAASVLGAPTIVFTSPRGARLLPGVPRLHAVSLDNQDARRFSCGLTALKGELASRLLLRLESAPHGAIPLERTNLLRWLHDQQIPEHDQAGLGNLAVVA
jgi:hypothetical protein